MPSRASRGDKVRDRQLSPSQLYSHSRRQDLSCSLYSQHDESSRRYRRRSPQSDYRRLLSTRRIEKANYESSDEGSQDRGYTSRQRYEATRYATRDLASRRREHREALKKEKKYRKHRGSFDTSSNYSTHTDEASSSLPDIYQRSKLSASKQNEILTALKALIQSPPCTWDEVKEGRSSLSDAESLQGIEAVYKEGVDASTCQYVVSLIWRDYADTAAVKWKRTIAHFKERMKQPDVQKLKLPDGVLMLAVREALVLGKKLRPVWHIVSVGRFSVLENLHSLTSTQLLRLWDVFKKQPPNEYWLQHSLNFLFPRNLSRFLDGIEKRVLTKDSVYDCAILANFTEMHAVKCRGYHNKRGLVETMTNITAENAIPALTQDDVRRIAGRLSRTTSLGPILSAHQGHRLNSPPLCQANNVKNQSEVSHFSNKDDLSKLTSPVITTARGKDQNSDKIETQAESHSHASTSLSCKELNSAEGSNEQQCFRDHPQVLSTILIKKCSFDFPLVIETLQQFPPSNLSNEAAMQQCLLFCRKNDLFLACDRGDNWLYCYDPLFGRCGLYPAKYSNALYSLPKLSRSPSTSEHSFDPPICKTSACETPVCETIVSEASICKPPVCEPHTCEPPVCVPPVFVPQACEPPVCETVGDKKIEATPEFCYLAAAVLSDEVPTSDKVEYPSSAVPSSTMKSSLTAKSICSAYCNTPQRSPLSRKKVPDDEWLELLVQNFFHKRVESSQLAEILDDHGVTLSDLANPCFLRDDLSKMDLAKINVPLAEFKLWKGILWLRNEYNSHPKF